MSSRKYADVNMGEIHKEDKELADSARAKAGGATKLGRVFGVSKQAASQWGNTRPIPRHLRLRLREYTEAVVASSEGAPDLRHEMLQQQAVLEEIRDLLKAMFPMRRKKSHD